MGNQIITILAEPLFYIKVLYKSFSLDGIFYLQTFIGRLGWLDTPLPLWVYFSSYEILAIYTIVYEKGGEKFQIKLFSRVVMTIAFIIGVVLVLTSSYISWTPVGYPKVAGIQGRYFIPLAPFLFFSLHKILPASIPKIYLRFFASAHTILILGIIVKTLLIRYYD